MKRRPTIDYVGSTLVLLVVVLVPTFLGTLSFDGSLPAPDAALTTADASATALHALNREIQSGELPPIQALASSPTWWNVVVGRGTTHPGADVLAATPATLVAAESARLL